MYVSKIALPRVVQNVIIPSSHRNIVRITYAPQIAKKNTTISNADTCSVGLNTSVRAKAIGR